MMMPVILAALGPIVSSQQSDKLHLSVDPQERLLSRKYEWRPDYTSCPAIWKDGQPAKMACYNTNSQVKVPNILCPDCVPKHLITKEAYLCPQPEYHCQDIRGNFLVNDEWEKVSLGMSKKWEDERREACKTKAIQKGKNWMLVKKWYGKKQCYHSDAIPQTSEEGKNGYAGCGMVKYKPKTIECVFTQDLLNRYKELDDFWSNKRLSGTYPLRYFCRSIDATDGAELSCDQKTKMMQVTGKCLTYCVITQDLLNRNKGLSDRNLNEKFTGSYPLERYCTSHKATKDAKIICDQNGNEVRVFGQCLIRCVFTRTILNRYEGMDNKWLNQKFAGQKRLEKICKSGIATKDAKIICDQNGNEVRVTGKCLYKCYTNSEILMKHNKGLNESELDRWIEGTKPLSKYCESGKATDGATLSCVQHNVPQVTGKCLNGLEL